MIQKLANIIYTEENIANAKKYLLTRGVNSEAMRYPPVFTGGDKNSFISLSAFLPPGLFTDTLYFPITDVEDPAKLIGFDARYLGTESSRLRYRKFKEESVDLLLYYTTSLSEIDPQTPLIVTEGVIDAETLRPLGFPIISPLTAMHSFKFCCFLKAISNNIYFAYDNDKSGQTAAKNIIKETKVNTEFANTFKFLNFQGKDINESYKLNGRDYLFNILRAQLI
jgi:DNA primase